MARERTVDGTQYMFSECINCGISYCVPLTLWNKQRTSGGFHSCPNGHSQGWDNTQTAEAKLRRERDRLAQRVAERDDEIRHERERREGVERSLTATRGVITRIKNRVGHGICPCCNRTFSDLQRHMHSKHPTYPKEQLEAAE